MAMYKNSCSQYSVNRIVVWYIYVLDNLVFSSVKTFVVPIVNAEHVTPPLHLKSPLEHNVASGAVRFQFA